MEAHNPSAPDVIIATDYATPNGGAQVVALTSARGLAERGCATTLFTAVGPETKLHTDIWSVCLGQEEIVKDRNRMRAFTNGLYNRPAARAFEAELRGRDPAQTIVHVHSYTKALSWAVIATALDRGFPTVLTLHDFFITCPTGGFFVHRDSSICERRPLSLACVTCNCDRRNFGHKIWRTARTFLQNRMFKVDRRITHFVGVSDFSVRIMRPFLPHEAQLTVLRNPVDCEDLGPITPAANAPFVFIGRFSKEKGVLLFAEAAKRLRVPAVFVGDGELMEEARRTYPDGAFTGWLPAEEVRAWMRRARALVFPPLWFETLGLVVVEAAANGLPAIVASRCAATDYIRHEENGLVFEHGSADALCAQMQRLQEPGLAARLGRDAYEWYWADPWSCDRHVDGLLGLYEQVLVETTQRSA